MPTDRQGNDPSPGDKPLAKSGRLKVFFRELAQAPAATDLEQAMALLARTLLAVEDRLSGIKRGMGVEDDGRMYPAPADNRRTVPGRIDVVRFRSRGHNTHISSGGAILIVDLRGSRVFSKPGADGKVIEL